LEALSEGGIAPTAEAARHVEKMGARTVGRSIRLSLRRLPEQAGRVARAAATLDTRHSELALQLEAAAVIEEMNDVVIAPSVALGRETLRERAANDPAAPAELLAAAAFISVLTNEPAEAGAELASRALRAGGSAPPGSDGKPWFKFIGWFSQTTLTLLWTQRYGQVGPLLDASIAQARATGDSSALAVGLANRGWLALQRGDLSAAEGDTRMALAATELPAPPL
jgi:hypothetical protein